MGNALKKSTRILLIVLCVLLVGVCVWSAYNIIRTELGYHKAANAYNDLANTYAAVTSTPVPTSPLANGDAAAATPDPVYSPLRGAIDFAGLKSANNEYAAWIYSDGTPINYPVMYPENDSIGNYYYIDHMPDGSYSANGTLFMDFRNAADFTDKNTCIYGHNMKDGSMFASLHSYDEDGYFEEHRSIYLSTPAKNYRLDLIAGFVTEPTSFAYVREFESDEQFLAHIDILKEQSYFQSDVEVSAEDRLVTLSTCTYEVDDGRYVVVGKLVDLDI